MSDDHAVSLDFDLDLPLGDATFLGHPFGSDPGVEMPGNPGSSLGQVVALSSRGVRIDHRGDADLSIGQRLTVRLTHGRERLELPARVTQVLPRGFRHYTFGLVFDELSDAQRDRLYRLLAVDHTQLKVA